MVSIRGNSRRLKRLVAKKLESEEHLILDHLPDWHWSAAFEVSLLSAEQRRIRIPDFGVQFWPALSRRP
jgi:hypothetical protein